MRIDATLIGIMVAVLALILVGVLQEVWTEHVAKKQARKLIKTLRSGASINTQSRQRETETREKVSRES